MSDFEDRVEKSLDKLHVKVDTISIETVKNTVVLEEHQRRSEANEEQVNLLKEHVEVSKKQLRDEFQPTISLVEKAKFGGWVAVITTGLTYSGHKMGIMEMILKMFS